MHEISSTRTKTLYTSSLYNKKVYNLMMADIEAETLVVKTSYVEHLLNLNLNSVALVRERTIPTERPPPVGEVSANFCG